MPNSDLRITTWRSAIALTVLAAFALRTSAADEAAAGAGVITGKVVSTEKGEFVSAAMVVVPGTGLSTNTDSNGEYRISNVPAGTHSIRVLRAGFRMSEVEGVRVAAGATAKVDVPLQSLSAAATMADGSVASDGNESEIVELDTLVVAAEVAQSSNLRLLQDRQHATAVSDAISADRFSQLGIGDAAEAMSKVTGVSVVGGKYVVIRGLGDRYTNTLLNGVAVPSADPDRRAVQLDQFPSEVLESVVTTKSFTPDQPGAFAGGSVDLRTKNFPEEFFFRAGSSVRFRTNVVGEPVLTVPGGGPDWDARDDGTRSLSPDIPDPIPGTLTVSGANVAARNGDFSVAQELDRISGAFPGGTFFPEEKDGSIGYSFSLSTGNRIDLSDDRALGYIVSFTYNRDATHYTDGINARYSQGSVEVDSPQFVDIRRVFTPNVEEYNFYELYQANPDVPGGEPHWGTTASSQIVEWGSFAQLAFRPGRNHDISLRFFHHQSAEEQVKRGVGEARRSDSGSEFRENYDLVYTERGVSSLQLAGKSRLPWLDGATLEWRAAHSRSTQDEPDYKNFEFKWDFGFGDYNPSGITNNRYFRALAEDSTELGFDFTQPLAVFGRTLNLKVGGAYIDGERENRERSFSFTQNIRLSREIIESFPNPVGLIDQGDDFVRFGTVMREIPSNLNYDGTQSLAAGYVQADWSLGERWRAIGGVRFERTEMNTIPRPANNVPIREGLIDRQDFLPGLSLVYSLSQKANLRAAYGRTVARPTFREMANVTFYNGFNDEFHAGNADLQMSRIDNLDLRWEYFPRGSEVVAVSAFYKYLQNPIELTFNSGFYRPQNVPHGTAYGVEFEARQSLDRLSEQLRDFSLGFNFAWIESAVSIPAAELAAIRQFDPDASDTRELYGQSPYTLNVDFSYENLDRGTAVTLALNVVGERLHLVTTGVLPDVMEQPAPALDLVFSQQLGRHWKLKFAAENLLDPERETSLTAPSGTFFFDRYRLGRTFSLGLAWDYN